MSLRVLSGARVSSGESKSRASTPAIALIPFHPPNSPSRGDRTGVGRKFQTTMTRGSAELSLRASLPPIRALLGVSARLAHLQSILRAGQIGVFQDRDDLAARVGLLEDRDDLAVWAPALR